MKYHVMVEASTFAAFDVEADSDVEAIEKAKDAAANDPEDCDKQFEENIDISQWEIVKRE
jgi:hypothetical protein